MTFAPIPLPLCWGFDTNEKLTCAMARALLMTPFPASPRAFLGRYVSLGNPSPSDITPDERDGVFAAGWQWLLLVQHVEYPHWSTSAAVGDQHGAAAVRHAQLVEYPAGCHLAVDIEGVGTPGSPTYDYLACWAAPVHRAGYKVLCYDGYDDGLPLDLKARLTAAGIVDAWWSDFGPRSLPDGQRFAVKQHAQTKVAGIDVDPDEVLVPGVVMVMGLAPSVQELAGAALAESALAAPPHDPDPPPEAA